MITEAAKVYLDLPADEIVETWMPASLKLHAESVAQALGKSLSQYVVQALAERVAFDMANLAEWQLAISEQLELLKVLRAPRTNTSALTAASHLSREMFGREYPIVQDRLRGA